jgi:pyruvate/2-oxoglutarate/acetoin dehydrogenase E1 component
MKDNIIDIYQELLKGFDVSVELIDAQTLMPFDLEGVIVNSLKKTNRIIFMENKVREPDRNTVFFNKILFSTIE